jgi:hypothetical protein
MMHTYVVRIETLFTDTLTWKEVLAVRVKPSDQEELDRISDEVLNTWLEQNNNRPARYSRSVWCPQYR